MNETLTTDGDRTTLRMERTLRHPQAKVWRAITEPEHVNQWFPFHVELDLVAGAAMRFVEPSGRAPDMEGTVTEVDPPRLLAFTWGDDALRFELRPHDDGCVLVFSHTFGYHAGAASFAAGWTACLGALDLVLAGEPVESLVPDDMADVHERFVHEFGLDRGHAEATADGWQVVFDRQLTQPADVVWSQLADRELHVGDAPASPFTNGALTPGRITVVEPAALLEYDWHAGNGPAGRVRWELRDGTGQGARLVLTQTGPAGLDDARATALDAWRDRVDRLAAELARMR